ncbi:hypothetical protein L9F63_025485, partial [Diploptera punctata]
LSRQRTTFTMILKKTPLTMDYDNEGVRMLMKNWNPRVNHWSMMGSPFPTLAICLSYAYFSKVLGPRMMENRKPLNIRNILIVYNFVQTIFSSWIFYEVSEHSLCISV